MYGTTKQVKWATDIIALAKKELEIFKNTDNELEDEAIEFILIGFDRFINMNNAAAVIEYGQYFKERGKVDRLTVYKTMALIAGYKKIRTITLKGGR